MFQGSHPLRAFERREALDGDWDVPRHVFSFRAEFSVFLRGYGPCGAQLNWDVDGVRLHERLARRGWVGAGNSGRCRSEQMTTAVS